MSAITDMVEQVSEQAAAFERDLQVRECQGRATDGLTQLAAEASALAEAFEAVAELLNRLVDTPEAVGQLVRIDVECRPAGGAVELRAFAELTEGAWRLLAALRAGNINLRLVEQALRHPDLSCGLQHGVDAESGAAGQSAPDGAQP